MDRATRGAAAVGMNHVDVPADIVIREPRDSELALCRLLLPRASARPIGRHFLLAFGGGGDKLVGALSYRDDGTALAGLAVHVIPPFRRKGIGSRLLSLAGEEARRFRRDIILADVDLKSDEQAEPFFTSLGFRKAGTITCAEIDIQDLRNSMQASRERLQAADKLPESFRVVGLPDAPQQDVMRLYAEHITQMRLLPGLREHIKLEEASESIALLAGDKLAGFILARMVAGELHIPAWVVDPEFRGHQIGYALLAKLAERVRGRVNRLHFEFTDAAVVTARMLSVPGCRVTKIAARFERRQRPEL